MAVVASSARTKTHMKMASIAVGSPTGTRASPHASESASHMAAAAAAEALAELASRTWEI